MRVNVGLAALSLVVSLVLWVLVLNDQNPERIDTPDIPVPVEITRVPSGLVVMNNVEPVRFKIRAPRDRWSSLRASSFRASVDLSRFNPGIHMVPITAESSDPQVHVLEVIPPTVSLRLEEIQERTVPVKANVVGNVPFGYFYGTPKVDPEVVVVSGPSSLVQSVQTASVDLRLEGITVAIDAAFHPVPADSTGTAVRNVRTNPQTVKVTLPVQQQVSYKQVGVRATLAGAVAAGYWVEGVSTEPTSVTAVGDPKVLAGMDYVETEPVSVEGASSNLVQDARIVTPQGVSLVQQRSARIRVTVSALQTSQLLAVAPRVINLDPKLQVTEVPQALNVTIQGPAPVMQSLRLDSLMVTLDAKGLGAGAHSVAPSVSTPPAISVAEVSPNPVRLVLSPAGTPTSTPTPAVPASPGASATGTPTPAFPR